MTEIYALALKSWMNPATLFSQLKEILIKEYPGFAKKQVIREHGSMAKRLCNKDPFTAFHLPTLIRMFPNAKHILMIRDARATIHSMIERNVPVSGFNHSNPEVYYERLVQRPSDEARRILHFLDVPWSDDVLSHQDKIGDEIHLNP
ncbi:unnamed protein product [Haemonchus placei]|uniref:Protein-tyrosine sulfotransferase n=1 Tax=Haemonchus placei TaxID=6290 RepID=A0A0N4WY28_HAEPC|nr:unnamed protein product [Haemonchus placei]